MEPNNYDITISKSKQESIVKAVELLYKELDAAPKIKIHRPTIDYWRMTLCFAAWLSPILLTVILLNRVSVLQHYFLWITIAVVLMMTALFLKPIIVYLILLYQRFAPERIRSSCVFEPTCSNYMLQAIEKYGVICGVYKGIKRLLRCHYPNCGVDYP